MEHIQDILGKGPDNLSSETQRQILDLIHSPATAKKILNALCTSQFFEKYLLPRVCANPPAMLEDSLVALGILANAEAHYVQGLLLVPNCEDALIAAFSDAAAKLLAPTPAIESSLVLSQSPADLLSVFELGLARVAADKVSQSLMKFADLQSCLHLSKQGMKQFLLRNLNVVAGWKKMLRNAQIIYVSSESCFIPAVIQRFWTSFAIIDSELDAEEAKTTPADLAAHLSFCEKVFSILIALVQNPRTSASTKALVEDQHMLSILKLSKVMDSPQGALLDKQRDLLGFYMGYSTMNKEQKWTEENEKLGNLFKVMYKHFGARFSKTSTQFVGKLNSKENLEELLVQLSEDESVQLCIYLGIPRPTSSVIKDIFHGKVSYGDVLKEITKAYYEDNQHSFAEIMETPMYPTEEVLWDVAELPYKYGKDTALALPRLATAYVGIEDLLSRIYWLYRLDAAFHIREDLEEAIDELRPEPGELSAKLAGTSAVCATINRFAVTYVKAPMVGAKYPAEVRAEVEFAVADMNEDQKAVWADVHEGEALFLVSFNPTPTDQPMSGQELPFDKSHLIQQVRGCEVSRVYDGTKPGTKMLNVFLDPLQYRTDMELKEQATSQFAVIVRRPAKDGSKFLRVLKALREIAGGKSGMPKYLEAALTLGEAESKGLAQDLELINKAIPLLVESEAEFTESVAENELVDPEIRKQVVSPATFAPCRPGFKLNKQQMTAVLGTLGSKDTIVTIEGAPVSGKSTLGAVIAATLTKLDPQERVVIMADTSRSLENIFGQLEAFGVHERYMVLLGTKRDRVNEKSLGRQGRVDYLLTKRLLHLSDVKGIAESMGVQPAGEYTCESAMHLYNTQVVHKWEEFLINVKVEKDLEGEKKDAVARFFPFKAYVEKRLGHEAFTGEDQTKDLETAKSYWHEIESLFQEVKESRALEIIRNPDERANYLVSSHARVIGMTASYAAESRDELLRMGLGYSTLVVDNAAVSPLWETLIPLTLASATTHRVVLIGDMHQTISPSANEGFKKVARMDKSFFELSLALPISKYSLTEQFEVSAALKALVASAAAGAVELEKANAGFAYPYQWIDVVPAGGDKSNPAFGEDINLAEAEYVAATVIYMCVLGYSCKEITVLAATKAQKALIKEILSTKGTATGILKDPLPAVSTIDHYQGLHNRYVLISLVKSESLGCFKDSRRLLHACTRATHGLYIFGSARLFSEIVSTNGATAAMRSLMNQPLNLLIVPDERQPTVREREDTTPASTKPVTGFEAMYEVVNGLLSGGGEKLGQ